MKILSELFDSQYLEGLFHDVRKCVVELWVMTTNDTLPNNLIYGWVIPSSFSNGEWNTPKSNKNNISRLSAYLESGTCKLFLESFANGCTLEESSQYANINISTTASKFSSLRLANNISVKLPTLIEAKENLSIDWVRRCMYTGISGYSASISTSDKRQLIENILDRSDCKSLIEILRGDTNINFSSSQGERFGEIELLWFPEIDNKCRSKIEIDESSDVVSVMYIPEDFEKYSEYFLLFEYIKDGNISSSIVQSLISKREEKICFSVDKCGYNDSHGYQFKLLGIKGSHTIHLSQNKTTWMRGINISGNLVSLTGKIEDKWLMDKSNLSPSNERIKNVQSIEKSPHSLGMNIDFYESHWEDNVRDAHHALKLNFPPKTNGYFFSNYSGEEGRLKFVEWWKNLFKQYKGKDFYLFDPYFEDIGVRLIVAHAQAET